MKNKLLNKEKGITLIALVITIIVLIILAGVSINLVLGENGIIRRAKQAKEELSKAAQNEQTMLNELGEYISNQTGWRQIGTKVISVDGQELEVGDKVLYNCITEATKKVETSYKEDSGYSKNQIFTLPETYEGSTIEWYVLGAKDGNLLIGSSTIKTDADAVFYLKGQIGYKNGIEELKKICALYGQSQYVENARSIEIEDIDRITGYDPNHTGLNKNDGSGEDKGKYAQDTISVYGNEVTLSWGEESNKEYPVFSYKKDNEITPITGNFITNHNDDNYQNRFSYFKDGNWINIPYSEAVAGAKITTLKNSCYFYYPQTLTYDAETEEILGIDSNEKGKKAYSALFNNGTIHSYWLGSRVLECGSYGVNFGWRIIRNERVTGNVLAYSHGQERQYGFGVRVAVSLKSNVKLTSGNNGYTLSF